MNAKQMRAISQEEYKAPLDPPDVEKEYAKITQSMWARANSGFLSHSATTGCLTRRVKLGVIARLRNDGYRVLEHPGHAESNYPLNEPHLEISW